jgi:Uma2 family endonuclease
MVDYATPHGLPSVEEYLQLEEASAFRHEHVRSITYAHAEATKRHHRITLNIASRSLSASRSGPCRIYSGDVKLRAAENLFYYPNVRVPCGPEGESSLYEDSPCLGVEVTSPSTASIARREKMLVYRRIQRLKAYLVFDQESPGWNATSATSARRGCRAKS